MTEPEFDVQGAARRAVEALEAWEPEDDRQWCDRALLLAAMRIEVGEEPPPPHLEAMRSIYLYGPLATRPFNPSVPFHG